MYRVSSVQKKENVVDGLDKTDGRRLRVKKPNEARTKYMRNINRTLERQERHNYAAKFHTTHTHDHDEEEKNK